MPWPLPSMAWLRDLVGSEIPTDPAPQSDPLVAPFDPVKRALSPHVVNHGTYSLGKGGRKPLALMPFDAADRCDCSGYVSWAMGFDRYQPGRIDGDWISTTAVYRDATGPHRMFRAVPIGEARPGDLVVYPSTYRAGVRTGIGHVGMVVGVPAEPSIADLRVAHCAASRNPAGGAVRVSDGRPWARSGIVVRRV